jgi:hypothetical protein
MVVEGRQKKYVSVSHLQVGLWSFIKRCRLLRGDCCLCTHIFTKDLPSPQTQWSSSSESQVSSLKSQVSRKSNQPSPLVLTIRVVTFEGLRMFSDTNQLHDTVKELGSIKWNKEGDETSWHPWKINWCKRARIKGNTRIRRVKQRNDSQWNARKYEMANCCLQKLSKSDS